MVTADQDMDSLPRGGRGSEHEVLAAGGLLLAVVSPVAVLVAVVTLLAVMRQVSRGWREIAAVGIAGTVVAAVLIGLAGAGGSLLAWVVQLAVIGVPLGLAAGAGAAGMIERWARGAQWHPAERRRLAVEDTREQRLVEAMSRPGTVARHPVPVLGVFRSGDLRPWVEGHYVVPPGGKSPAMGLIGESGSGKTITAERLLQVLAARGYRTVLADFKGTDPELPERVIAARLDAHPAADCRVWPAEPLDMWRGDGTEIFNRLMQVEDYSETFYRRAAELALRLAITAPGEPPVRDSRELLKRLEAKWLKKAWENTSSADSVKALEAADPKALPGVKLRYEGFFAALGTRFDGGFSWGDADLSVLRIPTLAEPDDAMAAARMMLADFGAYCVHRKPRDERICLIVDEFSAVTGAAPMVIDLAERVRDAGGLVVPSAQSYMGLGRNHDERERMLEALAPGGVILHRTGNPGEVIKLAGTRHKADQSWHLNPLGRTGQGSVRTRRELTIDPDKVQQLPTGSAYVVSRGRALSMSVLQAQISPLAAARARNMISRAGEAQEQMRRGSQHWQAEQRQVAASASARRNGRKPAAAPGQGTLDEAAGK